MRNISFALTTDQVRARQKTVTRRLGWRTLQPGTLLRAVEKGMGLQKGEKVQPIAVLRVEAVRRERLGALLDDPAYGARECAAEGFPQLMPDGFVRFFSASHNNIGPDDLVTRIEFSYVES